MNRATAGAVYGPTQKRYTPTPILEGSMSRNSIVALVSAALLTLVFIIAGGFVSAEAKHARCFQRLARFGPIRYARVKG